MSDTSVMVYKFGLPFGPEEGEQIVRDHIWLGHRYYNIRVAIENERRAELRVAENAYRDLPRLKEAHKEANFQLKVARANVKEARHRKSKPSANGGKARKVRTVPVELTESVEAAKQAKYVAYKAWDDLRREAYQDEALQLARDVLKEKYNAKQNLARAESVEAGLYWGTYLLIEAAHKAASDATPLYDKYGEPNDLAPKRWYGEGMMGLQLQAKNQCIGAEIFDQNQWMWVNPVSDRAYCPEEPSGVRRKLSRTFLNLRVGSEGRTPIWAKFPMVMHRQIPDGARVTWAQVNLIKIGPRERWTVDLTVDMSDCKFRSTCGEGRLAVNIGWREFDDERIRASMCMDEHGTTREIALHPDLLEHLREERHIRSRRDQEVGQAKDQLGEWIKDRGGPQTLPVWFQRMVMDKAGRLAVSHWKSPRRLAALYSKWGRNRFEGDSDGDDKVAEYKVALNDKSRRVSRKMRKPPAPTLDVQSLAGYAALDAWHYHDFHLWQWEASSRKRSLTRRKDTFRKVAAELASKYRTLVMHDTDLRVFAVRKDVEDAEGDNQTARGNRHSTCVSELRLCLEQAFKSRGGVVEYVKSSRIVNGKTMSGITHTCNACGEWDTFDAAAKVSHVCSHCGAQWDQDVNACRNILREHTERGGTLEKPSTRKPRKRSDSRLPGENKWQCAKRMSQERKARIETARNSECRPSE